MAASKERDQNIQKVIKVAQSLFISEGVAATSINRIAREAGLTPMSVYRYFGTKDSLVLAAWRDALVVFYEGFMARYQERVKNLHTGYDRCLAAMAEYNSTYISFPEWYRYTREMLSYTTSPEAWDIDMNKIFWQFYDREIPIPSAKAIEEGIADGSVRPDLNTRMFLQLMINAYTGVDIFNGTEYEVSTSENMMFYSDVLARYIKADT